MDPETVKLGGGTAEAEEEDQGFFLNSYYIEWAILSILITTVIIAVCVPKSLASSH